MYTEGIRLEKLSKQQHEQIVALKAHQTNYEADYYAKQKEQCQLLRHELYEYKEQLAIKDAQLHQADILSERRLEEACQNAKNSEEIGTRGTTRRLLPTSTV